jgi:hypothetical protein
MSSTSPSAVANRAVGSRPGRIDQRCEQLVDARREGVDLGAQRVDLVQQHPRELGVVLVKPAAQRLDQRVVLGSHLAAGQTGEPTWITFASDQRFEHVAHRHRIHPRHHRRHLDQRVFEQLLHALPVAGAFAGQIHPKPGVVPQLPDRCRRHETRSQQTLLGELGQPHRIEFVFSELN